MTITDLDIRIADWASDSDSLSQIRQAVFIDEQKVPEELEWDEHDNTSTHFLVTLNNKAVASARLKADGQIGRMAVLKKYRNQGIGSRLLQYVLQYAASHKLAPLYLHAQLDAVPFYEKQGFIARGEVFYEADIPHRAMLKISAK